MYRRVLAFDFDGTLAEQGTVPLALQTALEQLHTSGCALFMVTGRRFAGVQLGAIRADDDLTIGKMILREPADPMTQMVVANSLDQIVGAPGSPVVERRLVLYRIGQYGLDSFTDVGSGNCVLVDIADTQIDVISFAKILSEGGHHPRNRRRSLRECAVF